MFIVLTKRLGQKVWHTFHARRDLDAWVNTHTLDGDIVIDASLSQCYATKTKVVRTTKLIGLDDAQKTDLGSDTFPIC